MDVPKGMSPSYKQTEVKKQTLNFAQAMEQVVNNKKIHKLEWIDKEYYGVLDDEVLKIHKPDELLHPWIISLADLVGEDYVVIE